MITEIQNKMIDIGTSLPESLMKVKDGEFLCNWSHRAKVAFELAQANQSVNIKVEPHGKIELLDNGSYGYKQAKVTVASA